MDDAPILARIRQVLTVERDSLSGVIDLLPEQAEHLVRICLLIHERTGPDRPGRLVCCGIGKAGLIARKIAATCTSTGTPSLFLHPAEARHGDLGMIREEDLVLFCSHSGASEELLALVPSLERIGCTLLAMLGSRQAPLAKLVHHCLHIGAVVEACPLGLAPSSSTTALLALGDAIALAVQELRHFSRADYARFHPGGSLGRQLMTCAEAMRPPERLALVTPSTPVLESMQAITRQRSGCAILLDADERVVGLFSDGDLRRALTGERPADAILHGPVADHATCPCTTIGADELLQRALHAFSSRHFDELPVVDADGRLQGLIDLQDLAHRGFEI